MELEIQAMSQCHEALKPLDEDRQKRVIQWLVSKFDLNTMATAAMVVDAKQVAVISHEQTRLPAPSGSSPQESVSIPVDEKPSELNNNTIESFDTVAEFFAAVRPDKEWEKALAVASYLQVTKSLSDFTSFEVNKELKNLGHGNDHITEALQINIDRKPQLILQLRKDGKSQQARKKFKVSIEGLNHVKRMLKEVKNDSSGN